MAQEKQISMSELRKLADYHLSNLRCTELTRALLRKEFNRFFEVVDKTGTKA